MTPREAERQGHRRARALAIVRTTGREVGALRPHLACVEERGRWNAVITVHAGDERVVHEAAQGDDPTAALLALPGALALVIEATRAQLLIGLREGEDLPEEEPSIVDRPARRRGVRSEGAMTPREAERQGHRRARALAIVRTTGREVGALRPHLACVEERGRWNAVITVHAGDERVVHEAAQGDDPTAALLALPGALALVIEATRAQLLIGLREGEDLPEEEPSIVAAPRPKASAKRHARTSTPDDGQVCCKGCGAPVGTPHEFVCPNQGGVR